MAARSRHRSAAEPPRLHDLSLFGRVGAAISVLGLIGVLASALVAPEKIDSVPALVAILAAATAIGLACLVVPWTSISPAWILAPVLPGVALIAVTVALTGGLDSVFCLFYIYVGVGAAYVTTLRYAAIALAAIAVAAALPLLYDLGDAGYDVLRWFLLAGATAVVALLLQDQRLEMRSTAARLRSLAREDSLTSVANRRGFEERAVTEIARARRAGTGFAILYLDLDGFKRVNDFQGHAAGDEVLRHMALAAAAALRSRDFLARFGGDEFAALLPGADDALARTLSARLVDVIERTAAKRAVAPDDPVGEVSASIGVALYPEDGATLEELMRAADHELLWTKRERADRRTGGLDPAAPIGDPLEDGRRDHWPAPDATPAVVAAGWPLSRVGLASLAGGAALAAAWLAFAGLGAGEAGRTALVLLATFAAVAFAARAAARTRGTERVGWALLAAAGAVGWIPVVGLVAALVFGVALGVVAGGSWRSPRVLLDTLGVATLAVGYVTAFLVPAVVDRTDAGALDVVSAVLVCVLAVVAASWTLLLPARTTWRGRPDVWAASLGYLGGAAGAVALVLSAAPREIPSDPWAVVFPLAGVAVAAGAALRAARPEPALVELGLRPQGGAPDIAVANVLLAALLILSVAVNGNVPAGLVPVLLLILVLRHLRSRAFERENAILGERARRSRRELATQSRASLLALGTALEARDLYTGAHGVETVELARRVGERMGLGAELLAEVETVALLHDVGKIGMPDEILRKPRPLTHDEREVMGSHPVIGERILQTVPGLEQVAKAVRHEHERWDGTGYPEGLTGEEIPLSSRIVLVCDAYHAMTSDRPYRDAMPRRRATAELRRNAGSQFDPEVVDALLACLADEAAAGRSGPRLPGSGRGLRRGAQSLSR